MNASVGPLTRTDKTQKLKVVPPVCANLQAPAMSAGAARESACATTGPTKGARFVAQWPIGVQKSWLGPLCAVRFDSVTCGNSPKVAKINAFAQYPGGCMSPVEQKVKQIIVEQLGVDESPVDSNASFVDDLGADSLDIVELVMAFEEAFELEIPDEDAREDYHRQRRS